jgi:hypothetical protein
MFDMRQPKAVITFPVGELRVEEETREEDQVLAFSGFLGGSLLNGQVVGSYSEETATLKYTFKVKYCELKAI